MSQQFPSSGGAAIARGRPLAHVFGKGERRANRSSVNLGETKRDEKPDHNQQITDARRGSSDVATMRRNQMTVEQRTRFDFVNLQIRLLVEFPSFVRDNSEFEYDRVIGEGGFAQVWLATEKVTGHQVAIKEMRTVFKKVTAASTNSNVRLLSFAHEIQTMVATRSRFVLPIYGFTIEQPFTLITQYVGGGTLYDKIQEDSLDGTQLTIIAMCIAQSMVDINKANVIHRDLKAANVLLDENGLPLIADFGVAKILKPGDSGTAQSMSKKIGTFTHMAPEVIRGDPYSAKCDVYSYGLLVYEMAEKHMPFHQKPVEEIPELVLQKVRPGFKKDTTTPASLQHLIRRCWQDNPDDRPTFAEVVKMFEKGKVAFAGADAKVVKKFTKDMKEDLESFVPVTPHSDYPRQQKIDELRASIRLDAAILPPTRIAMVRPRNNSEKPPNPEPSEAPSRGTPMRGTKIGMCPKPASGVMACQSFNWGNRGSKLGASSSHGTTGTKLSKDMGVSAQHSFSHVRNIMPTPGASKSRSSNKAFDALDNPGSPDFDAYLQFLVGFLSPQLFVESFWQKIERYIKDGEPTDVCKILYQVFAKLADRDPDFLIEYQKCGLWLSIPKHQVTLALPILAEMVCHRPELMAQAEFIVLQRALDKDPQEAIYVYFELARNYEKIPSAMNIIDILLHKSEDFVDGSSGEQLIQIVSFLVEKYPDYREARMATVKPIVKRYVRSRNDSVATATLNFACMYNDIDFEISTESLAEDLHRSTDLVNAALTYLIRLETYPDSFEFCVGVVDGVNSSPLALVILMKFAAQGMESAMIVSQYTRWMACSPDNFVNALKLFLVVFEHPECRMSLTRCNEFGGFLVLSLCFADENINTAVLSILENCQMDQGLVSDLTNDGFLKRLASMANEGQDDAFCIKILDQLVQNGVSADYQLCYTFLYRVLSGSDSELSEMANRICLSMGSKRELASSLKKSNSLVKFYKHRKKSGAGAEKEEAKAFLKFL